MHRRTLIAALFLASIPARALAADPQQGQQPSFAPPEEDNGVERPFAPDQRFGHVYLMPTVSLIGITGLLAPNLPAPSLAGLGYDVGGIVGLGIGRNATLQVFGDRAWFSAPGNCLSSTGCYGWSYALGLGVTYHLTQGMAVDPWGSFGIAYRRSTFYVVEPAAAVVDGLSCANGKLCPQNYEGIDVARIAFGGDFYPLPWLGFGPYVEADAGMNLHRAQVLDATTGQPLMPLPLNVTDGPRAYCYFQLGFRVAFDPMRRSSLPRTPVTGRNGEPSRGSPNPSGSSIPLPGL